MSVPFDINGVDIEPGARREVRLKVSEFYAAAPVHVPVLALRGLRDGPRLFLTAAIHGDEINGTEVVRRLMFHRDWSDLRGILVCVPVVNVSGFFNHSRYLPDRRDLNRSFPGNATGSNASRIAHRLFHEIVRKCDYGIDFHTAAVRRANHPHIRVDWRNHEARRLARAFGCGVLLDGEGTEGALRRSACEAGVPVIVFEAGETFKFQHSVVKRGIAGVLNVMGHLNMIDHQPQPARHELLIRRSTWVRAERGGLLSMKTRPGAVVDAGQVIAVSTNPFGRDRRPLKAPFAALVLGITTWPSANPGDPVAHLARIDGDPDELRDRLAEAR